MANLKGFTLVEVLVALLIVSLVFLSSILSLSEMTRNSGYLQEKTLASLVASNLITQIQIGLIKADSVRDNRVEMAGINFYWSLNKGSSPLQDIEEINIEIKNISGKLIYTSKGYFPKADRFSPRRQVSQSSESYGFVHAPTSFRNFERHNGEIAQLTLPKYHQEKVN